MSFLGSAAGAVAGGLMSAFGSSYSAKQEYKYNKELYQHRYQWQREDMEKAGYNPILGVYNGAGATGSVSVDNPFSGMPSALANAASADSQNRLAKKQAVYQNNLLEKQGDYYRHLGNKEFTEGLKAELEWSVLLNTLDDRMETIKQQRINTAKEGALLDSQILRTNADAALASSAADNNRLGYNYYVDLGNAMGITPSQAYGVERAAGKVYDLAKDYGMGVFGRNTALKVARQYGEDSYKRAKMSRIQGTVHTPHKNGGWTNENWYNLD